MDWTDTQEPNERIRYHHVLCETPVGEMSIEWKGWKKYDAYAIYMGGEYMSSEQTLEDAKHSAAIHLLEAGREHARLALALVDYLREHKDEFGLE